MKNKILVVEDDGSIYNMIKEQVDEDKYEFIRARNVSEAIGEYKNSEEEPFACYIVDLQIGSKGLTEKEMSDFFYYEGYAWIKNHVLEELASDEEKQNFKKKTIICSKYIPKFMEQYAQEELKDLTLISKKPHFEEEVRKAIEKICKR
jgi:CheY-like chemotaxis protein